jgi:hypothetical protein
MVLKCCLIGKWGGVNMLSNILRGITTALLVTVITLFAGMVWGAMGFGGLSTSGLLDIGLMISCIIGGFRTAKETGEWVTGGITGAGYVAVGTLLLALFLPIRTWGFIQVMGEGTVIGLVAGAFGAGGAARRPTVSRTGRRFQTNYQPYYAGYGNEDQEVNSDSHWNFDDDNSNQLEQEQEQVKERGQVYDLELIQEPEEDNRRGQERNSYTSDENDRNAEVFVIESENRNRDFDSEVEWPWDNNSKNVKCIEAAPQMVDGSVNKNEGKPWWE